jgi:hypothetical protein
MFETSVCLSFYSELTSTTHARIFSFECELQLGDFGGASQCYDGVVQLEPEHSKAWYNLGYLNADAEDQVCVCDLISVILMINIYIFFYLLLMCMSFV